MFLLPQDLKNSLYSYQIDQITQGDESITLQAINAAVQEVQSYLQGNYKKEQLDGRLRYDVPAIFRKEGAERNALLLSHCITIARWYIVDLCNADVIYEHAKERYDRSVGWLKQLAKGEVSLHNLPLLQEDASLASTAEKPFLFGSRAKFNHE